MMRRRDALRVMFGLGGLGFLGLQNSNLVAREERQSIGPTHVATSTKPGAIHVVVFSNFEGWSRDADKAIQWFDACTAAYPSIRWTHMYNPMYLVKPSPQLLEAAKTYNSYLRDGQVQGKIEVGLHLHMFHDLIEKMGVTPRAYPYAGDKTPECNDQRKVEEDRQLGYDVLMTGYSAAEKAKLLDVSIDAFVANGFGKPKSFCAGYSAANPELQAVLVQKGLQVSFSAQVIPPDHYGSCWERLLKWSGNITPLTIPYKVARNSILPPPQADDQYLELVEFPLNMGVDSNDLYLAKARVTRTDMFDRHYRWAKQTGNDTAVAIGVHTEVISGETWGQGPVSEIVDQFLSHVARRATDGDVEIRYGKVSEVAQSFRNNKSLSGAL